MKTTIIALALLAALLVPTVAVAACKGFMCDYHPYRYDNYGNRYTHYDDNYHRDSYYDRFDDFGNYYYDKKPSNNFYNSNSNNLYIDNDFYSGKKKTSKKSSTYYRWYW